MQRVRHHHHTVLDIKFPQFGFCKITVLQHISKMHKELVCLTLAAVRVVSKSHVLHNTTLTLRRKPPKDPGKLLLRGLNPHTSLDHVELYVENMTRMTFETDFTLYPSPNKDLVLVHFKTPLSKGL